MIAEPDIIEPVDILSPSGRVLTATQDQEDGIFELLLDLQKYQGENGPMKFPHRPEKLLAWIRQCFPPPEGVRRETNGVCGIILDDEGHICASVGLFIGPMWWTDCLEMWQQWLFVRPGTHDFARLRDDLFVYASHVHKKMERELKAGGYKFDLPFINSHMTGGHLEAKDRIWSRYGDRIGSIFLMR